MLQVTMALLNSGPQGQKMSQAALDTGKPRRQLQWEGQPREPQDRGTAITGDWLRHSRRSGRREGQDHEGRTDASS
jgi:hypothetical protein